MADGIHAVKDRIAYLTRRIRSSKADAEKAGKRAAHFEKLAKQGIEEWRRADKRGDAVGRAKAKRKTKRAHRKLAFWDEVADDAREGLAVAVKRRAHQRRKLRELSKPRPQPGSAGFTVIDGREVPNWMVEGVLEMRQRGLWSGIIVSGRRTPEYSRQLCRNMCGADSCPGRCAGLSSNHTCPPSFTGRYPEGALDVTDYYRFGAGCRIVGLDLRNDLPVDRVHYSVSGR